MKRIGLAVVLGISLVACGTSNQEPTGVGEVPTPVAQPSIAPTSPPTPLPTPSSVAVRLSGVHAPGSVRVRVAAVELTVGGRALAGELRSGELDLATGEAWRVMTFDLPADAPGLELVLTFEAEGLMKVDGKTLQLDLRGAPLGVVADVASLRASGNVLIEVDLAQSLLEQDGQRVLLPDFRVRY